MKEPIVISVNPGTKTIGDFNEEGRRYDKLSECLAATIAHKSQMEDFINFFTGIDSKTSSTKSVKLAVSRIAVGILFLTGSIIYFNSLPVAVGVALFIAGISLVFGFYQRICCLCVGVTFALFAFKGEFANINNSIISIIYGCAIPLTLTFLAILGPGKFSIDQLIRKFALRLHRKKIRNMANKYRRNTYNRKGNDSELTLSYKSYFELSD